MSFKSTHPLGDCPMHLSGDQANSTKGLIVLQEWWGMNEQIKQRADGLAGHGFVTLVPDLYRGKVATDHEEAGHLAKGLDWKGAVQDIRGAAEYLLSTGCKKVGVTGFCMGGALSLAAAALIPELVSAAAPFYGIPSAELADVSTIKIPVQAHFAEKDPVKGFSSAEDAKLLESKLAANPEFKLYMYEDCNHAFTNPTSDNYNEQMATLALERLVDFMKAKL